MSQAGLRYFVGSCNPRVPRIHKGYFPIHRTGHRSERRVVRHLIQTMHLHPSMSHGGFAGWGGCAQSIWARPGFAWRLQKVRREDSQPETIQITCPVDGISALVDAALRLPCRSKSIQSELKKGSCARKRDTTPRRKQLV